MKNDLDDRGRLASGSSHDGGSVGSSRNRATGYRHSTEVYDPRGGGDGHRVGSTFGR